MWFIVASISFINQTYTNKPLLSINLIINIREHFISAILSIQIAEIISLAGLYFILALEDVFLEMLVWIPKCQMIANFWNRKFRAQDIDPWG